MTRFPALLVSLVLLVTACQSGDLPIDVHPDRMLPASKASVESAVDQVNMLRADSDASDSQIRTDLGDAIARLRADSDRSDEAIRADIAASTAASEKAYMDALAAGKSQGEAVSAAMATQMEELQARLEKAIASKAQAAADADEALARQAEIAEQKAEDAKGKAEEAQEESSEGTTWWQQLLGVAVTAFLTYIGANKASAKMLDKYDEAPFVGPKGERVLEEDLVEATTRVLSPNGQPRAT